MYDAWNPPLPPIPTGYSDQAIDAYVGEHTGSTFVQLLEGLYAYGSEDGDEKALLLNAASRVAVRDPRRGIEIVEIMACHDDPRVRADVADIMLSLLGRGMEKVERIVWDQLLQDENDAVCFTIFGYLDGLLANNPRGTTFVWTEKTYAEVYDGSRWPEHISHMIKLGRVSSRINKIAIERK